MNKKGSITLNLILAAIIVIALLVIFLVPKVRIFVVGAAILITALIMATKGELTRTKSILVVAFVAIGLVIIFFGNGLLGQTQFVGSSTLGLQQVQYFSSSDSCFNSGSTPLWVYTLRGGGLGQSASGTYTPDEVGEVYSGNTEPAKTFSVDTSYRQYCDYPIVVNPSATPIYTLEDPFTWTSVAIGDAVAKCVNDAATKSQCTGGSGYFVGKISGALKCYCARYNTQTGAVGSVLNFASPSVRTDMTITAKSGTETFTKTLSSNNDIQTVVSPNVCAIWQGNLVTGQTCGLPSSDTIPVYLGTSSGGNWVLVSKDKYDTYKTAWDTLKLNLNSGSLNEDAIRAKITEFKATSNAATNRISFGTINNPTTKVGATISKELTTLIQYPVLTMYIKANWLGVTTPVPIPSITQNPTSECFASGTNGQVTLSVKNVGERGDINVYGTCDNQFTITRDTQSYEPQEEKIINLVVTGSSNATSTNGSCTIFAKTTSKSVSKTVKVCVTGYPTCTQTEPWCEGGNVLYCPTQFSPDTIKEDCLSKGETCDYDKDGIAYCKSEGPVCGNTLCEEGENKLNCREDCGGTCGNGKCEIGETYITCDKDCDEPVPCDEKTPKFMGYTEVTTTKQTIWSRIGITQPRQETYCKATNAPYVVGGALVLILGLAALFIIPKKKVKGKSTKYGKIGK